MNANDDKINGYKIWHCSYNWHGSYGAFRECECVVIAEIESKAIGMALMEYSDTHAGGWSAEEIPCAKEGVHHISESRN